MSDYDYDYDYEGDYADRARIEFAQNESGTQPAARRLLWSAVAERVGRAATPLWLRGSAA